MTKQKKNYPQIKIKELNNKSRKGRYIYILLKKGQRGKYYKEKDGVEIESYLHSATGNLKFKRGGVVNDIKTIKPEHFIKKQRNAPKISSLFRKGVYSTHLENALTSDASVQKKAVKTLLSDAIIRNKGFRDTIIDTMLQDENFRKISNRIEYKMDILGNNGETLGEATYIGGKSINDIINDIKSSITDESEVDSGYARFSKSIEGKGYTFSYKQKGTIKNIRINITFRKGKTT